MSSYSQRQDRKRTIRDKVISTLNTGRYSLTEPLLLRIARARYASLYHGSCAENPLVTVYIATYNRGELLVQRAVPSVLEQTYSNFELWIIGDCCTDDTEELVSQINDPRIRFFNLPARVARYPDRVENHWFAGSVVPSNRAFELARGKWIARIDDDDVWTADHIESLLRFAQEGLYEFVSGQHIEERHGKIRVDSGIGLRDPYFTCRNEPVRGNYPKIGAHSTYFYRSYLRYFKYNLNCWRKSWNRVSDIDLALRMFRSGVRMGFLEKPVLNIVPRPGETGTGREAYEKSSHFVFR